MKKILLILPILLWCSVASATPAPASISGNVTDGNTLVITGASFGIRDDNGGTKDYLCKRFYQFESDITDDSFFSSPYGDNLLLSWELTDVGSRTSGENFGRRFYGGNRNRNLHFAFGTNTYDTMYTCFWYKHDYSGEAETSNKIWRTTSATNEHSGVKNYYMAGNMGGGTQLTHYPECSGVTINQYSDYTFGETATWQLIEILLETGASGRARIWINGTSVLDSDDDNETWDMDPWSMSEGDAEAGLGSQIGYGDNTIYMGFDDYYVDFSQARVMISDKSTWTAANQKREIQIPSAWADGEITCELNIPTWTSGTKLYLYVVADDGTVNASGLEIEVGESGVTPEDPDPPSASGSFTKVSSGRLSGGRIG